MVENYQISKMKIFHKLKRHQSPKGNIQQSINKTTGKRSTNVVKFQNTGYKKDDPKRNERQNSIKVLKCNTRNQKKMK